MRNIHNQVKNTPQLIYNYLQENVTRNSQPVIQHDYLTKTANETIYEYTGIAMKYRQIIKSKLRPVWIKYFSNEIVRLSQGVGGRV